MSSSLIDAVRPNLTIGIDVPADLGTDGQRDLLHALAAVPDPRHRRGVRYRLASLLAVAVCAVLAGASTFAAIADWAADLDQPARTRLGFSGRIPVGSTVWRFLIRIDAQVLQAVLTGWLRHRLPARPAVGGRDGRVVIAVDGKVLRGAKLQMGGRCTYCRPTTPSPASCLPSSPSPRSPMKYPRSPRCWSRYRRSSGRWPTRSSWPTHYTPKSATPTPWPPAAGS